jgi:hypothetical protein
MVDKPYLRYTELPPLFSLLRQRELTLLNPDSWDDRNDSAYIRLYREKQKLKSVLALCFTQASETYHHWRVFAPTASGVCIRFREAELKAAVRKVKGLRLQPVEYLTLNELRSERLARARLPFLKRFPFKPEHESRMLWESDKEERASLPVPISLDAISRITLSPWLHPALVDGVKAMIKSIPGCAGLRVYRSTLIGNHDWIEHGRQAT